MMTKSIFFRLLALPILILLFVACEEEDIPAYSGETYAPVIVSLTADKVQTTYGSDDPIKITCEATGGNLGYLWEVDMGDIFPLNEDNSKIRYTGSSCCIGDKVIKCTVSNNKGTASKDIKVKILGIPEIYAFYVDKEVIGVVETSVIKCLAAGGEISFDWQTTCGEILPRNEPKSEVEYVPNTSCLGVQTITCTVTNSIGSISKDVIITVK